MELAVAGCSGSGPGRDGAASCYLVRAGATTLVLDCGPGALAPLQGLVDLRAVDAVLLSHLHPDHCLDLCAWHVAQRYGGAGRSAPLPVLGPSGTQDRLERAYAVERQEPLSSFAFGPFRDVGEVVVRTARAHHPGESYAIRLEHAGTTLVYTGDTAVSDEVLALAQGADLLLAEAAAPADGSGVHLSGAEAGALAREAGVRGLVLTHIPTWVEPEQQLEQAEAAFGGQVVLARSGLVVETAG
ncbi:ribonuclease BN (tRNA processing enzyme) [Motilibacter rhizosphaerae]|uniref:Ribonuclease BN (tRNA processing enzyme) n=1 Tax=Motilibacter rhizosphaerae TaxID=598652 RepID=A0A4Q7NSG5_9ACTN|nr:MBL fold metallo-hydrolase [Motilibacter rhizosphaerae]RZS89965.1 ribonuclease BN (tRNA processing enzyme) [Motilibacter rhizosphaerae]